jgi:chromosome segregation ATPase
MDLPTILQGVASGLLTGGASAGTTFLAVFKDIKKRIADLEKGLGDNDSEPPTGLHGTVDQLSKSLRALRNEIESWRDSPPDWLMRIAQRASRSSTSNEMLHEFEDRIFQRLKRVEEDLDRREDKLHDEIEKSSPEFKAFVSREEYEEDSKRRALEIRKIQENLKSTNSFLRGVLAALGYIDPEPPKTGDTNPEIRPVPRQAPVPRPQTPIRPFTPPPLKKK